MTAFPPLWIGNPIAGSGQSGALVSSYPRRRYGLRGPFQFCHANWCLVVRGGAGVGVCLAALFDRGLYRPCGVFWLTSARMQYARQWTGTWLPEVNEALQSFRSIYHPCTQIDGLGYRAR
jgi:hypothetical protein